MSPNIRPPLNLSENFRKRAGEVRIAAGPLPPEKRLIMLEVADVWDRLAADEERYQGRGLKNHGGQLDIPTLY